MNSLKRIIKSRLFKKILFISSAFLLIVLLVFFIFRNSILHSLLEKKCQSFKAKYNAELKIENSYFTGFTGIALENISLLLSNSDTLFTSKKVYLHLNLFPLLIGNVSIDDVVLENTVLSMVRENSKDNYSFLLKSENEKSLQKPVKSSSYAEKLDKIFSGIFDKIPDNLEIRQFVFNATLDSNAFSLSIPLLNIEEHEFLTEIGISDNGKKSSCIFKGEINKKKKLLKFSIYGGSGKKVHLPYLQSRYGLNIDFDTINAGFSVSGDNKNLDFLGKSSIYGLLLNHKKIAGADVTFQKLAFDFNFHATETYIELDSSSAITYNRFVFNPYVQMSQQPKLKVNLKINNEFIAKDLFESLPNGLFSNFDGIKTKGKLQLKVLFDLDMEQPDSLKFSATLSGKDFSVLKWGITDFRKINGTFSYTVYESGNAIKTFDVGPENQNYVALDEISSYLKEAVLISENGGFFWSDGFNVDAFRQSIVQNIKEGRFVRGGSTIDMQLVKNVFLNRNKTIARKAEEILIVWLINTLNLCSKEKMYEVYLNLIEWGPGVYGISEASQYYFKKKPSKLNLPESIFLASIIPRPKWFKYSFDENGKLLDQNQAYFSLIAQKLIEKETASFLDTNDMLKKVELKGEAKKYLAKDTAHFNLDSLLLNSKD